MLRTQEKITCRSRISFSGYLWPLFTRSILAVAQATPAVLLDQIDQISPKTERDKTTSYFFLGPKSRIFPGQKTPRTLCD